MAKKTSPKVRIAPAAKGAKARPRWLRGWKVVDTISNGRLESFGQCVDDEEPGVIYEVGKITRPKKGCGPLCVFGTEAAALEFWPTDDQDDDQAIYPCLYMKSRHRKAWDGSGYKVGLESFPVGTVLADAVKLLPRL